MGLFKKGFLGLQSPFRGFDRRNPTGKKLGTAADIVTGEIPAEELAVKGVKLAGKGALLAGKFVINKIKDAREAKALREEKIVEIKRIREEDPSGYIKSREWAEAVRELLKLYPDGEHEWASTKIQRQVEIKNHLKEIREEDPSGYKKFTKFWYSAEKKLNKYFEKQTEERLKEENPELFDKFYNKLKRTYFWCSFEEILGKYNEKVAEVELKTEDPEAYKSLHLQKKIKLILIISAVILILGLLIYIFF